MPKGYLALADGHVFVGELYQEQDNAWVGELVFSTAMTGYTEVLSDPSFYNQIVVLTSAEIGNYGVNSADFQSDSIQVKGLVVRNFTDTSFSWREHFSLLDWLKEHKVPLLKSIDTRALVSHVREKGVMMAAIGGEKIPIKDLSELAKNAPSMAGQRLSPFVSVSKAERFIESPASPLATYRIAVLDFGVKREILRYLAEHNCEVIVVPQDTSAEELLKLKPDGICISNGPGDPGTELEAIKTLKKLLGKIPLFGICLGHQILAQVLGFSTFKLKCGHRGSNHPVLTKDKRVIITAQNHGFAINHTANKECEHNLTDDTNEGLYVPELMLLSVQYHPEGAPGPKDATFYFQKFITMVSEAKIVKGKNDWNKALAS